MNKDLKQPWIDALRSGKFKQTKNNLKDGTGHCCLGVLCELSPEKFKESLKDGFFEEELIDFIYWSGMSMAMMDVLAQKNDSGKTFDEIADYIEENL